MRATAVLAASAWALLLAGCASGEGGPDASLGAAPSQDRDEELICRRVRETGSHLGSRRVCQTRDAWRQADVGAQDLISNTPRDANGSLESSVR